MRKQAEKLNGGMRAGQAAALPLRAGPMAVIPSLSRDLGRIPPISGWPLAGTFYVIYK